MHSSGFIASGELFSYICKKVFSVIPYRTSQLLWLCESGLTANYHLNMYLIISLIIAFKLLMFHWHQFSCLGDSPCLFSLTIKTLLQISRQTVKQCGTYSLLPLFLLGRACCDYWCITKWTGKGKQTQKDLICAGACLFRALFPGGTAAFCTANNSHFPNCDCDKQEQPGKSWSEL